MSGVKRPRDDDLDFPRIRYIVTEHDRAFERLLKEDSYEELREAIRAKLGLKPTAKLQMYRVYNDLKFDLEDENDFAAMKSAAYASDAFAIHITYAYKRPPRPRAARGSTHVATVLPEEAAEDHEKEDVTTGSLVAEDDRPAKKSAPKSKEVIEDSDVEAPSENEAEPPQAKKARPKPQQSAKDSKSVPTTNSKRKAVSGSDDDDEPSEKEAEPPKKKQKSDKPSKEKAKAPKASTKEQPKSSSAKSKKTTAADHSNKSPETSEKASRATADAQEEDRVTLPPTKKSKSSKKDDESTSTFKSIPKSVSKPVKPSRVAVEITSILPVLNHAAKPKDRITDDPKLTGYETDNSETTTTDHSSVEVNSTSKSKTNSKNQQESANRKGNRDDPKPVGLPTQVTGKKKDGKKVAESESSKKSGKPVEESNEKAKDKKTPADAVKNKAKDKKVISSAQTPSFKEPAAVSANDRLAKSSSASSIWPNEQSIDSLVTELEGTIGSNNTNGTGTQSQKIATSKASQPDSLRSSNVPILPRKSKLSHVTVQSHDEGSESDSSESSSSSSSSNSDGEDVVPNRNSSLAKTAPSLESESSRQSMNLDAVNLDELIRGPSASAKSVVASLSMLEEEEDNGQLDKEETEEEELEEEEEVETKHSVIPETARRLSTAASQVVDDDSESDSSVSPSPPPQRPSSKVIPERENNNKTIPGSASDENSKESDEEDNEPPAVTSPSPAPEPAPVSDKSNPVIEQSTSEDIASAMEVEISANLDESRAATNESNPPVPQRVSTPPVNDASPSHTPAPTTPLKRATPAVEATPKTPRTIQRMKDKEGRLPAPSTPMASFSRAAISVGPDPLPKVTRGIVEEEEEEAISDVGQSTVRATRTMTTRSRPTRGASKEPSAPPPSTRRTRQSSVVPVPEQRVLRSSRAPSTPIKPTTAKGKRRLTKTIMESESEFDLDKEDTATVIPRITIGESEEPAVLGSQWQVLPPLPPTLPTSLSSQVDELQSNATSQRVRIKSPELTAGSRRLDENDVEELIGSSDTPKASRSPLRSPLFLPGASQLSPSQYPIGLMDLDDGALQGEAEAPSEAESEPSDKELSMPQHTQPFKSIFPSLSELSFNKFRPSFLMKNQSQGTKPQDSSKALKKVEESDSDDDDDDDDEDDSSGSEEKVSHIPKNKRAGAGVVKKRKTKGLLQ